jgi:hypothetical protein
VNEACVPAPMHAQNCRSGTRRAGARSGNLCAWIMHAVCSSNTGWKGNPRPCGLPATRYFEGERGDILMCEAHAALCADQMGRLSRPFRIDQTLNTRTLDNC